MKTIYTYLIVLFISSIFNCYTVFGFLVDINSNRIQGFWLLFYAIILPVKSMTLVFNKYKAFSNFHKYNLFVFFSYFFSTLISGIGFFDFKNFVILGDGATKYIIGVIYFTCFISAFSSLVIFQWKSRSFKRKFFMKMDSCK